MSDQPPSARLQRIVRRVRTAAVSLLGVLCALTLLAFFPPLDVHPTEQFLDWKNHSEDRAIDRRIEASLGEKWQAGVTSVRLSEVLGHEAKAACLGTWYSVFDSALVLELQRRANRNIWWRHVQGHSTLLVEYQDSRVRAYDILSHGYPLFGGTVIRFSFDDSGGRAVACSQSGQLAFVRRPADTSTTSFLVRGK